MKKSVLESIIRKILRENDEFEDKEIHRIAELYVEKIASDAKISKKLGILVSSIIYAIFMKIGKDVSFYKVIDISKKAVASENVRQKVKEILLQNCNDCSEKEMLMLEQIVSKIVDVITGPGCISELRFETVYNNFDELSAYPEQNEDFYSDFIVSYEKVKDDGDNVKHKTACCIAQHFIRYLFNTHKHENVFLLEEIEKIKDGSPEFNHNALTFRSVNI